MNDGKFTIKLGNFRFVFDHGVLFDFGTNYFSIYRCITDVGEELLVKLRIANKTYVFYTPYPFAPVSTRGAQHPTFWCERHNLT